MDNLIFSTLPISKETLQGIEKMGFEEATPIQSQAIPAMLNGKDVIAQAPTGTGKTCAFGIPMIESLDSSVETIQGVVLCPTRELAIQTTAELQKIAICKRGVKIVPIYGGQQIDRQIMALKKRPSILVATPGRLMDHLRRKTVKLENLKMLVLDEADEMLNMGFREDLDVILQTVSSDRQTVLFSATMPPAILEIANKYQKEDVETIKVARKELTVPTVAQYYLEVRAPKRIDVLCRLIDCNNFKLSIVFCNTKRRVEEVTNELSMRGYAAQSLHGDMKQRERDRVMNQFRKGVVDILVATDVAARGIDIDDIDAVFNLEIPTDEEYYVHRIGRTGRAKREGIAYSFVSGREMFKLKDIMRYTKANITLMKTPRIEDVVNVRVESMFKSIDETISSGDLESYAGHIEAYLNNDEHEYTTIDIAAAMLKLLTDGKESQEEKTESIQSNNSWEKKEGRKPRASATRAKKGMSTLFLNVGAMDKAHTKNITSLFKSVGLEPDQIGRIDVKDKFSFADVSEDCTDKIILSLNDTAYGSGKRKLVIEKTNKSKDDKSKPRRRKSFKH
ncbi:MAG: DEAD/DEAH box helicase [Eubacteriales bacterium]|nr:DEAD/DEAH box helicase [Eubacteriales bacterium]